MPSDLSKCAWVADRWQLHDDIHLPDLTEPFWAYDHCVTQMWQLIRGSPACSSHASAIPASTETSRLDNGHDMTRLAGGVWLNGRVIGGVSTARLPGLARLRIPCGRRC